MNPMEDHFKYIWAKCPLSTLSFDERDQFSQDNHDSHLRLIRCERCTCVKKRPEHHVEIQEQLQKLLTPPVGCGLELYTTLIKQLFIIVNMVLI